MRIFTIVGLAVLGVTLALTVRSFRPELALLIGVATGIAVLLSVVGELTGVIDALRAAARQYGVDEGYLGVLLKIIGIAYLAQFGVQICRDAGESAAAAKVELAGRVLVLAAALGIGCTLGYLFGGSYRMDWQPVDTPEQVQTEAIRQQLLDLGFPEDVLDDLTPEDIAACDGAVRVVVETEDYPVNDGRNVLWEAYNEKHERYYVQDTVYDVKELRLTGVAVQLPGAQETWMVFHHFLWTTDPGFYGTEAIQIRPAYRSIPEGWSAAGDVTGRVLYDRDGQTFAAPYASLGAQTFTANTVLWGEQTNTDLFAAFSLPRHAEHARGYVAYSTTEALNGYILSSGEYYVHQQTWLQYPVVTAMEKRMTSAFGNTGAFYTVQHALQFFPEDAQTLR